MDKFGELGEDMSSPVSSGVIQVSPSEMMFLARKHKLQFLSPGDTLKLKHEDSSVTCICENYPWYWKLIFCLRVQWNRCTN